MRRAVAALAPVLPFLLAGCVGPFKPSPRPVPSVSSPAPAPSSAPACTATGSAVAPDAKYLPGDWICRGSTTEMRFRFSADGRYSSRESLEYEIPLGRFVVHRDQVGTYQAAGDRLELVPIRSTRTRRMPEDPGNDYVDKPEAPTRRVFTFRATPTALNLHENGGCALVLVPYR
jgi:hypothetical protein